MQTFLDRGRAMAFRRSGAGRPAVFLHNGGTSHAIWRAVTDALAGRCDSYAVDLLGYGASDRPGRGYTLADYTRTITALIDARGLAPVALVGNCMGSAIALSVARARPRDVSALVLVNPLTAATAAHGPLGVVTGARRRAPRAFARAASALGRWRVPPPVARRALRWQLGRATDAAQVAELDELGRGLASPGQLASLLAVVDDLDAYAELDRFTPGAECPPICTIWGVDNPVLSAAAGRRLNRALSPAREVWLQGCGHLPMLERPELVASTIDSFLAEVAP